MNKEKTHRFFQIVLIIFLFELTATFYGFISWISVNGFLSATKDHRWQIRSCLIGFPVLFILTFYFPQKKRFLESILYILNGCLIVAVLCLAIFKPYVLDRELVDPHMSTTVYKVNHLLKYSGLISLGIIGIFFSLNPARLTPLKIFWIISPLLLIITAWYLLGLNIPSFNG